MSTLEEYVKGKFCPLVNGDCKGIKCVAMVEHYSTSYNNNYYYKKYNGYKCIMFDNVNFYEGNKNND